EDRERPRRPLPLHRVRAGPGAAGDVEGARPAGDPLRPRQHHPRPGQGARRPRRRRQFRRRRGGGRRLRRAPRRPDPARAEEAFQGAEAGARHAGGAQHQLRPASGDDPEGGHERGRRRPQPSDGRQGPALRYRGGRRARGQPGRDRARPGARRRRPRALTPGDTHRGYQAMSADTAAFAPIDAPRRILALDAIRGFALLGIFLMNVERFTRPMQELGSGIAPGTAGPDHVVAWLVYVFVQGKFTVLLSLLFGMVFAVMSARAADAATFNRAYLRRCAVLLLYGVARGVLLWPGDILHSYAVAALFLLA